MRKQNLSKLLAEIAGKNEEKPFGKTEGRIKTWRDPYDAGYSTTRARQIQFQPGLTVLAGCNGSGKSTLLRNIKAQCEKQNVPYLLYDNQKDGGSRSIGASLFYGDVGMAAARMCASEGEQIVYNLGDFAREIGEAIRTEYRTAQEIWILLDATDSGFSIDNVLELKDLFRLISDDTSSKDLYFVVSANGYEMANGERCLDVMTGKEIRFSDYEDYKRFILKTRKKKEERLQKAYEKRKQEGNDKDD